MRSMVAVSVSALWVLPAVSVAQAGQEARSDSLAAPRFTVTAGMGISTGWYGAQAEWYAWPGRLSVFGGLGYTFRAMAGHPEGLTYAGGTRLYTSGVKHRGFLALVVGQVATSVTGPVFPGEKAVGERHYGPALLGGYQRIADNGFTFMAALGIGYAPRTRLTGGLIMPSLDLGFGYTWR